jgi:hypothetical protein
MHWTNIVTEKTCDARAGKLDFDVVTSRMGNRSAEAAHRCFGVRMQTYGMASR